MQTSNHLWKIGAIVVSLIVGLVIVSLQVVFAHGSMERPISRSYNCYLEDPESPDSDPCRDAVVISGKQQFYDWHEVNQLPAGQHQDFVPDGELCSGGRSKYAGLDQNRDDWVAEYISADVNGNYEFRYNAYVPHSTDYFWFYVTQPDHDPTQPLNWDDLELFCSYNGDPPIVDGSYRVTCPLPDRTGRHIIYNVWQRDDSPEAFYSCSDVIFDDGPTPTPTPDPIPGECNSAEWHPIVAYDSPDFATWAGKEWQASYWTRGDEPGTAAVWQEIADCGGGGGTPTPSPTPSATPEPEDAVVSIDDATFAPNETMTMTLDGQTWTDVGAATIDVDYDSAVVEVVGCLADPANAFGIASCNDDGSTVRVSLIETGGVSGDPTVADIGFHAIGADGTSTALDISIVTFADTSGAPLTVTDDDGSITITNSLLGDVDCSTERDAIDALFILQHTINQRSASNQCPPPSGALYTPLCDVDASATCNVVDALFVLQCIVGVSNVLCPEALGAGVASDHSADSVYALPPVAETALVAQSAQGVVGETFASAVVAQIPAENALSATTFSVTYDPNIVSANSCAVGEALLGVCHIDADAGRVEFVGISAEGATNIFNAGTIEWVGLNVGTATVTVATDTFAAPSGGELAVTLYNGNLSVSEAVPTAINLQQSTAVSPLGGIIAIGIGLIVLGGLLLWRRSQII